MQLTEPLENHDRRPVRFAAPSPRHEPRFNRLYNSLRSDNLINGVSDLALTGSIAITNAATTTVNLALSTSPNYLIRKWPDATQAFLLLRSFSLAPSTAGAVGDLQCVWYDSAGNTIPLGDFSAASAGTLMNPVLSPNPLTDTGSLALGSLSVNWLGGIAGITVGYSFGWSVVYLLAATTPYERE